jgi:glycosyltransferase involved in cell wall biosynthesis
MRIAFLSTSAGLGGAERVLLDLLWSLRTSRPDVECHLVSPAEGPLTERAAALGVTGHIVPMAESLGRTGESHLGGGRIAVLWALAAQSATSLPGARRYIRHLHKSLARISPTVVHSNGIKTHLASAAARPTAPLVWHVHDFLTTRLLSRGLLRLAGRRVSGVIAVSDAVAADAGRLLPKRPVVAVPNAIDLDAFTPTATRADLDRLAGAAEDVGRVVRVGLVATFATWKGHDVFLDAAARITNSRPELPLRFYIVGGPIYQTRAQWSLEQLRRLAGRRGLADRVRFVPFQPNPAGVYTALDVVVHASTRPEPFGLTIAEAMACGRAVVVSRGGGAAELFTEGHDAVGVTPGDAAELAAAIARLTGDPDLRRRLGANAGQTAGRRFDRRRLGPQLLQAYETLFSRENRRRT